MVVEGKRAKAMAARRDGTMLHAMDVAAVECERRPASFDTSGVP